MKTCIKCGVEFPTSMMVNGHRKNVGSRKYCLTCSPWGSHNTKKLRDGNTDVVDSTCAVCNRVFKAGSSRQLCNSCVVTIKGVRNKMLSISYLGGECKACGFRGDPSGFDFHHRDSGEKEFLLSGKFGSTSWKRLKVELDKCDLLCSLCHRIVHSHYSDNSLMSFVIGSASNWQQHPWFDTGVFEFLLDGDVNGEIEAQLSKFDNDKPEVQRRRQRIDDAVCITCGAPRSINYRKNSGLCRKCSTMATRRVDRPTNDELLEMKQTMSWGAIGEVYGVSDNAVKKWVRAEGGDPKLYPDKRKCNTNTT